MLKKLFHAFSRWPDFKTELDYQICDRMDAFLKQAVAGFASEEQIVFSGFRVGPLRR